MCAIIKFITVKSLRTIEEAVSIDKPGNLKIYNEADVIEFYFCFCFFWGLRLYMNKNKDDDIPDK
jgi:hypothetical protein